VQAGAGEDNAKATPERTIGLTTSLYSLLQFVGKPRLLAQVGAVRDAAAAKLGATWSHARYQTMDNRIDQQLGDRQLREALAGAQALLECARAAGEEIYPEANYDLAMACFLLARVLRMSGGAKPALPLLAEARQRFEAIVEQRASKGAERMASLCLTEQGDCLWGLGRLNKAAAAYEKAIRRNQQRGDDRNVAVCKSQLGTVRLAQRCYPEALAAYQEARQRFTQLGESESVATVWHQTGMVYQEMSDPEAAEDAYRQSLAIEVRLDNRAGQAATLGQLGNLYDDDLERPKDAVGFYRQAADMYRESGDATKEGVVRNNLAATLRKLCEFEEARREVRRAMECNAKFGHASSPWTTWGILAKIENDAGNPAASAEAGAKARDLYLAYRRAGGENHFPDGRIALAVTDALTSGDPARAAALLEQLAARPDAPDLHYTMAAEILLLLETLEKSP